MTPSGPHALCGCAASMSPHISHVHALPQPGCTCSPSLVAHCKPQLHIPNVAQILRTARSLQAAMAVFDVPEAIAVARGVLCAPGGGLAALTRLQARHPCFGAALLRRARRGPPRCTCVRRRLQCRTACAVAEHTVRRRPPAGAPRSAQAGAPERAGLAEGDGPPKGLGPPKGFGRARRRRPRSTWACSRTTGCWPRPAWAFCSARTCTCASTGFTCTTTRRSPRCRRPP